MRRAGLENCFAVVGVCFAGCLALLLVAAPISSGRARDDETLRGKTSQGKPVQVRLDKHHRLTSLAIAVASRCTDQRKRTFSLTFSTREINHNTMGDATGMLNEFAGSFFPGGGPSYSERASFSARVTLDGVAGTARATRTFESGPACRTGTIHFGLNL
jgi:hypothetical protein